MVVRGIFILLCLIIASTNVLSQEICDNGIDDNGNGLIDLNDPECACYGVTSYIERFDILPNPDFENFSCCPNTFGDFDCLNSWVSGTGTTPDYIHTCNFIPLHVINAGLVPFPSGFGAVGAYAYTGFKEYPSVCLTNPLLADTTYTFTFKIGAALAGASCPYSVPQLPPTLLTLYGSPVCNMPLFTTNCPSIVDPNWQVIGTVLYQPLNAWQEISILFTPTFEVGAIMIGAACVLPSEYSSPCFPYFVYDDFETYEGNAVVSVELAVDGQPCNEDYFINAFINHQGGQWQWYFNGVAISGQTNSYFYPKDNLFLSGLYTVTYTTEDGCSDESIEFEYVTIDTTYLEVSLCNGASVWCGGVEHFNSGTFEIKLRTADDCDSIVVCQVLEIDPNPPTNILISACDAYTFDVCGISYSEAGLYTLVCQDVFGCDSTINLDLRILAPEAYIAPPDLLICDDLYSVVLDGSGSSVNPYPQGTTLYFWTGPPGSFVSSQNGPFAEVNKEGFYCLEIVHEVNGTSCSNIYCVEVISETELPLIPEIGGPRIGCIGDQLHFILLPQGSIDPNLRFEWSTNGLEVLGATNSDTILVAFTNPGYYEICGQVMNACGPSDPNCFGINIFNTDTILINNSTCDPALAGITTVNLRNFRGCDSVVITNTVLLPSNESYISLITCDSSLVRTDTLRYFNQFNCDSLVYVSWEYQGIYQILDTIFRCESGSDFIDTIQIAGQDCDSLFLFFHRFVIHDTTRIQLFSCNSNEVGIQIQNLASGYGCDSIIVFETLLLPSNQTIISSITCDSTLAGIDTLILINQFGCDSTVIFQRQFQNLYERLDTAILCGEGENFLDTIWVTGINCDSLFITEYIYFIHDTIWLQDYSCNEMEVGIREFVYNSSLNCDSLVIVQTLLAPSQDSTITGFTCFREDVMFERYTFVNEYGCDSIITIDIKLIGIDTIFRQGTTCNPELAGTSLLIIPGLECDTSIVLETILLPSSQTFISQINCTHGIPYSDTFFLENQYGCDSMIIRSHSFLNINFDIDVTNERCIGERNGSILINHSGGGMPPFEFRLNNGNWQASSFFPNLRPGHYEVSFREGNGCLLREEIIIEKKEAQTIALDGRILIELGDTITLIPQLSFSPLTVLWTPPIDILCDTCLITSVWPPQQRIYQFTAADEDGCPFSTEVLILVRKSDRVFIPSAFTPNGDGINDSFTIFGPDILQIKSINIYDRWGNRVFSKMDFPPNNPAEGWDGSFKNQSMNPAVFVYVVELEMQDKRIEIYSGDVTLIR